MEKLRKIIPFGIISIIGTGILYAYQNLTRMGTFSIGSARMMTDKSIQTVEDSSVMVALDSRIVENISESSPNMVIDVVKYEPNLAMWFFSGTLLIILSMLIIEYIKYKKK
jgi:hypothetical protein